MSTTTMPKPVANVVSINGVPTIYREIDGLSLRVGDYLITTDQAEAYANALVLEVLTVEGVEAYATAKVREALEAAAVITEEAGMKSGREASTASPEEASFIMSAARDINDCTIKIRALMPKQPEIKE